MNKVINVGGGGIAVSGCVFWIALIVFIFVCLPAFASAPIVGPILESSADNAAAKRAKEQAEADRAEAARVQAEAAADSLRAYTDAGITAIETDRKHAHPLAWLEETLVEVLAILSIPLSLALLALAVVYYKDPETARRIVGALVTLRPKREQGPDGDYQDGPDGDYRDGPTPGEIVNL